MPFPIPPKLFPGRLSKDNRGAFDWGKQNLLAFGCQSYVVIVDPISLDIIQTLDEHRAHVSSIKWCGEDLQSNLEKPYKVKLASGDKLGNIIIWNALEASIVVTLGEGNNNNSNSTTSNLGILNSMVSRQKNQDKENFQSGSGSFYGGLRESSSGFSSSAFGSYGTNVTSSSGSTNPHGYMYSNGQIVQLEWHPFDTRYIFSIIYPCSLLLWNIESGTKLWKTDIGTEPLIWMVFNPFDFTHLSVTTQSGLIYFMRDMKTESSSNQVVSPPSAEHKYTISSNGKANNNSNDFIAMYFSPITRNIVYFLLSREVLIFDLKIHQGVGSIALERSRSSFKQLIITNYPPYFLYCLHEDGSMSAWEKKKSTKEYKYECKIYTEMSRFNKQSPRRKGNTFYGIASNPLPLCSTSQLDSSCDNLLSTICNDGTVWMWQFKYRDVEEPRFNNIGIAENLSSPITSLCVSPFPISNITNTNTNTGGGDNSECLVALGTYHGSLQIVDMIHSVTKGEYNMWNQPVRGVRWLSPSTLLAFTSEEVAKNEYKNRLAILDLKSGKQSEMRKVHQTENTFIRGIRISNARQYIIVLLKDKPFELWDLKTLKLLRTMKPFSQVTALEWAPLKANISPFETPFVINTTNTNNGIQITSGSNNYSNSGISAMLGAQNTSIGGQSLGGGSIGGIPINGGGSMTGAIMSEILDSRIKEEFVFTLPDGSTRSYIVENNNIVQNDLLHADLGIGIISSLAWKDDWLVSGDTLGTIHCWNLSTKKSTVFSTNKGLIRRIRFSPSRSGSGPSENYQILVLFNEGEFGIWDIAHGNRVSISNYIKSRDLKALDIDWLSDNSPIVATSDGSLRVLDRALSLSNSPIQHPNLRTPLSTPHLLPTLYALQLKVILQHYISSNSFSYDNEDEKKATIKRSESSLLDSVDKNILENLSKSESVSSKCLQVAMYYGNEEEIRFWTLARWAISQFANKSSQGKEEENSDNSQTTLESSTDNDEKLPMYIVSELLLDEASSIRKSEMETADLYYSKQVSISSGQSSVQNYELKKKIAEYNILLGEKGKAVEMLLDGINTMTAASTLKAKQVSGNSTSLPNGNANNVQISNTGIQTLSYLDALKAAVISASMSTDAFHNTIKLIASSMIAQGNLDEGVQLLCLIGKSFEACRILQAYDRWTDAAWLAKITLGDNESGEVMRRWGNYLQTTKNLSDLLKAVQIFLSLGDFAQVLQLLYNSSRFDTAALFYSALEEKGIKVNTDVLSENESQLPKLNLPQEINLEYGQYLYRIGIPPDRYWKKAGERGLELLILANEKSPNNSLVLSRIKEKGFLRNTQ